MTNKTEDKFYFGNPDVMATPMGEHGAIGKLVSRAIQEGAAAYRAGKPAVLNALDPKYKGMSAKELEIYGNFWMRGWDGERIKDASAKPIGRGIDLPGMRFSRPGQPERFAKPQFRSVKLHNGYLRIDVNQGSGWERYDTTHEESFDGLEDYERGWEKAYSRGLRWSGGSWRIPTNKFSRPGQPDKFDASSLERGSFAEASKSPILGKLLSEKAMPEGGWRAVQAGSDTLVISFEDGDVAGNFARRVAGKGYSATSPVATTGRYWNVEVKNG